MRIMSRREASALVWEQCERSIRRFVESSFLIATLPNPPLELPDFPAIQPDSSDFLVRQSVGLFLADRAGFNHRMSAIVDDLLPDHVKRHIDPDSAEQRWISSNMDEISERVISSIIGGWLSSALDEDSPDTDRWYLAVSLLIGFSLSGSEQIRKDGFHFLTSIAMAKPPGSWSARVSGPHQLAWSPDNDNQHEEPPHPAGVLAAATILDTIGLGESSRIRILPYWLEGLTVTGQLCRLLEVPRRLTVLLGEGQGNNTKIVVRSSIQLLSSWPQESRDILTLAAQHTDTETRRELSSSLQRIASEDIDLAIKLMDGLLEDNDPDVRVLATSFLSSLVRSDIHVFTKKAIIVLQMNDQRMTQRIVDSAMREYLSLDPLDDTGLVHQAWMSSGESSRSRLSGLIIQQHEVSSEGFSELCRRVFNTSKEAYADLKEKILRRDSSMIGEFPH